MELPAALTLLGRRAGAVRPPGLELEVVHEPAGEAHAARRLAPARDVPAAPAAERGAQALVGPAPGVAVELRRDLGGRVELGEPGRGRRAGDLEVDVPVGRPQHVLD